jgi:hypothetical protein
VQEKYSRLRDKTGNETVKQKVKQRQIKEENKNDKKKKIKRHMKGYEASEKGTSVFFRNNITVLKGSQASSTCPENKHEDGISTERWWNDSDRPSATVHHRYHADWPKIECCPRPLLPQLWKGFV